MPADETDADSGRKAKDTRNGQDALYMKSKQAMLE